MFRAFFDTLKTELTGVADNVRIGIPHTDKSKSDDTGLDIEANTSGVTLYITFVNIENLARGTGAGRATIRVLFTAFVGEEDLQDEDMHLEALDILDEVVDYLDDNRRSYNLIATPEQMTNNMWSSFRIPLRPFLVYECPIQLNS